MPSKKSDGKKKSKKNPAPEEQPFFPQVDLLVNIIKENPFVELFHNELGEPYIHFPVDKIREEHWPLKNKQAKRWIGREYWKKYKKIPNNEAVSSAINALEGFAIFEGKKFELSNRVAMKDGIIAYSLANEKWEIVRIGGDASGDYGWGVTKEIVPVFQHYNHQQPQSVAKKSRDLWELFKYINIKDEQHRLLLIVWLISCFIADMPHPIIYLHGPQGSATFSTLLK